MSIFYQRLFNSFSLRWNVTKIFLIKSLFIIPIWLKLPDYSSFSYNPDFRNLTRGELVSAQWLHTMGRTQPNLIPVCSSICALKHTCEHSIEQLWHWLCNNHRFCVQTLTNKKQLQWWKAQQKARATTAMIQIEPAVPPPRPFYIYLNLPLPNLTAFSLTDQWKTEMISHCSSCDSERSLSHVQIQISSWV